MNKKKNFKQFVLTASMGAVFCSSSMSYAIDEVYGQAGSPSVGVEVRGSTGSGMARTSFGRGFSARDLMGRDVRNSQGEKLGEIKDVVIDLNSGRAPFAILSTGDKWVALPTSAFTRSGANDLVLNVDKEKLRAAPAFDQRQWPMVSDRAWASQVYSYYGYQPYWSGSVNEAAGASLGDSSRQQPTLYPESGRRAGGPNASVDYSIQHESAGARPYMGSEERAAADAEADKILREYGKGKMAAEVTTQKYRQPNTSVYPHFNPLMAGEAAGSERDYRGNQPQAAAASELSGSMIRSSDFVGAEVRSTDNRKLGEIRDLMIDLPSGHTTFAVLEPDRTLGAKEKQIAVPVTSFTRSGSDKVLTYKGDISTLRNAPAFDQKNVAEVSSESYAADVYRHFGQQPYWSHQTARQTAATSTSTSPAPQTELREAAGASQAETTITLHKEELKVAKKEVDAGGVHVRKIVRSETVTQPVELRRDEIVIERVPAGQTASTGQTVTNGSVPLREQDIYIPLQREVPVVMKEVHPIETVRIAKRVETERATIKETVRREELQIVDSRQNGQARINEAAGAQSGSNRTVTEPAGASTGSAATTEAAAPAANGTGASSKQSSDQQLEQRIQSSLKSDPTLGSTGQHVTVSARKGSVTLRGKVENDQQKEEIAKRVKSIGGVERVDNQLEIKAPASNQQ